MFRENKYTIEDIFLLEIFLFRKSMAHFNSRGISFMEALSASCKWKLVRVNKRRALCTLSITEYTYFRPFTRYYIFMRKKKREKYDIFQTFQTGPTLLSDRKLSFMILFRVEQ